MVHIVHAACLLNGNEKFESKWNETLEAKWNEDKAKSENRLILHM